MDWDLARLVQTARLTNGRVNSYGSPHLRSFANAANMQMGTLLLGIYAGRKAEDRDLVRWSFAATQNQAYHAPYGHGQRPYSMDVGSAGPSDQLYMSITDFFFRSIELVCQEDMQMHPSLFGRYTDTIDVNADLYQRRILKEGGSEPTWYRAMMFRGQSHDHRWEAFANDPYLAVLDPRGGGIGLTEAIYYQHKMSQQTMTWNRLMTDVYLPWVLITKAHDTYKPSPRPALPGNVAVATKDGGVQVTWSPVAGAAGYRIYRSETSGGPWTWVNSPYAKMPAFVIPTAAQRGRPTTASAPASAPAEPWTFSVPAIPDTLAKTAEYTDPAGTSKHHYFVTAEDEEGRESRWYEEERVK